MPIDQAQLQLDERVRAATPEDRMRLHSELAWQARVLAWDAADRSAPMTELDRARFLLRRLYPDLRGQRLEAIMDRLEADWRAGTWTGFRRPDPGD